MGATSVKICFLVATGILVVSGLGERKGEGKQQASKGERTSQKTLSAGGEGVLAFATYFGGRKWGGLREIAFDSESNIVVTGYGAEYTPRNFPQATFIGAAMDENLPVAKFTPDGKLLWMTIIGGSGKDRGYGVVVDRKDEIYIAGRTSSPDFPTTPNAFDRSHRGGSNPRLHVHGPSDAFALKLSKDGKRLLYSTLLGGSGEDYARGGLGVDAEGFAYVVGGTRSADFLDKGDIRNPAKVNDFIGGTSDAFIVKVSQDGSSIVYARFLGSDDGKKEGRKGFAEVEEIRGVAIDSDGHAYLHAQVGGDGAVTTPDAFDRTFNGGETDMYLVKLSPDGRTILYATYFGGSGAEYIEHRIALDKKGNVYVAGQTRSPDFPVIHAHQRSPRSGINAYLVKFDPSGKPVFSTYIDAEVATGPAVDAHGNIFVTGATKSSDFETTPDAYNRSLNGGSDAFLRIYGPTGKLLYSTLIGGSKHEFGRYVAVDGFGSPVITGETSSGDFPTSPGAYQRTHAGEEDGFLVKFQLASPLR